ncbi:MAG TPA: class I SAM-dependent methyltransferase [Micromonosporaceae bacterium]|nr:class I SAM-dependent methyltransferase [Micromonosporaceae bacterium]
MPSVGPTSADKLRTLGHALDLRPDLRLLDLACGKGEMLCSWAAEHQITGTGVDISTVFVAAARARAAELGVADRVHVVHGDAAGYVADEPVDVAACIGATWIGGGTAGTVELLRRSLRPGGTMLVGECFWRQDPPDQATVEGSFAASRDEFRSLPDLVRHFDELGCDTVEMVLANQDSWDRYVAAQWLNIRRWLDRNPHDDLVDELRAELTREPVRYTRYQREYLGWGVFVLMDR